MPLSGWERVGREDPYYKICLKASTAGGSLVGLAVGAWGGPVGLPAGLAAGTVLGFAAGYVACPYLAPGIKQKFPLGGLLSDAETTSAAEAMGRYAGVSDATGAIRLLAVARAWSKGAPAAPACANPAFVARQLLRT